MTAVLVIPLLTKLAALRVDMATTEAMAQELHPNPRPRHGWRSLLAQDPGRLLPGFTLCTEELKKKIDWPCSLASRAACSCTIAAKAIMFKIAASEGFRVSEAHHRAR